jgi:hypothetical protein
MTLGTNAHILYGQQATGNQVISAVPRNKFNFTCSLTTVESTSPVKLDRVANVTMPSFSARTQTLNSYNKKVIAQTGIDYTPITLTAYDTRDAAIEKFLKGYANYYFAGPMNTANLTSHNLDGKGYKLQNDRHYIKTFVIERKNSSTDTNIITIFNPVIASIDADTLDYSDSGLVQYRITFAYEGFNIETK